MLDLRFRISWFECREQRIYSLSNPSVHWTRFVSTCFLVGLYLRCNGSSIQIRSPRGCAMKLPHDADRPKRESDSENLNSILTRPVISTHPRPLVLI